MLPKQATLPNMCFISDLTVLREKSRNLCPVLAKPYQHIILYIRQILSSVHVWLFKKKSAILFSHYINLDTYNGSSSVDFLFKLQDIVFESNLTGYSGQNSVVWNMNQIQ